MKRRYKRLIPCTAALLILCLLLGSLLTACGGGGGAGTQTDPATDTATSGSDTATQPDTQKETQTDTPATEGGDGTTAETTADTATETTAETSADTTQATTAETQSETEPGADTEPETLPESDTEPGTEPETQGEVITLPPEPVFDPSKVERMPMPRLDIVTDNGQMITGDNINKPVYHCTASMSSCAAEYAFEGLGAEVHVRGNSTAGAPKKPLAFKFDEKHAMLDLNRGKAFKSWVLLADFYDETMLRNWTAFRLGDVLLENQWFSADAAHVEVYVNGQYQGVYTLCEKTQIKKNRINISEKASDDLTTLQTGYVMVGQGGIWWEENYFDIPIGFDVKDRTGKTQHYGSIRFVLSNGDEYSQAQRDFISAYCSAAFRVMEKALYHNEYYTLSKSGEMTLNRELMNDKTLTDAEKQMITVGAVMDLDAAARMCVLDEIAKNLDAMTFNLYVDLSPEGDGRLTLAAPWDFDHAMAKTKYSTTHSTRGWYATNLSVSDGTRVNFMTVMLGSFDWFNDMCSEVWKSHYDAIRATITSILVENYRYEEAFERDWERWGHPLNRGQTGHHMVSDLQSFGSHTDSAEFLADWLTKRVLWLNTQWGDGTEEDFPTADPSLLQVDFTKRESERYLTGFNNCDYSYVSEGLKVVVRGNDPYFSVNYQWIDNVYYAEDFPIVRVTCLVPKSNSEEVYHFEYHMCAGQYQNATSGVKTGFPLDRQLGKMHTYESDLAATGKWSGEIHSLRIDFFSGGADGDYIIIQKVELVKQ